MTDRECMSNLNLKSWFLKNVITAFTMNKNESTINRIWEENFRRTEGKGHLTKRER